MSYFAEQGIIKPHNVHFFIWISLYEYETPYIVIEPHDHLLYSLPDAAVIKEFLITLLDTRIIIVFFQKQQFFFIFHFLLCYMYML